MWNPFKKKTRKEIVLDKARRWLRADYALVITLTASSIFFGVGFSSSKELDAQLQKCRDEIKKNNQGIQEIELCLWDIPFLCLS